jgi:prepilin-type N-terminal cleavage/methylation domain-containing protein
MGKHYISPVRKEMNWLRHCLEYISSYFYHRSKELEKKSSCDKNLKSIVYSFCIFIFSAISSMKFTKEINNRGFTLFELMVSMTIFGLLMITVLEAVANIGIARTKSMTRITLLEELYFFSEKLATAIKDGWIIDYEEYWNRQLIGTGTASGHYTTPTGYGNYGQWGTVGGTIYGAWYYYCRSADVTPKVWTWGCIPASINTAGTSQTGVYQRYGQYMLQYTDYNGNADSDSLIPGDENGDGNIRGDEDDKDIGDGPLVLSWSAPELYLYNPVTKERTFFRWVFTDDPGLPAGTCQANGSGCLGNIEILRLVGRDIGLNHSGTTNSWAFDGNIDTWICHPDWTCGGPTLPGSVGGWRLPNGNNAEWIKMFPDYVSVRQLSFTIYPRKDPWKSWAAPDDLTTAWFISPFIQPYVRIQMTLGLAWEKRKLIRWDDPTIAISTTISLADNSVD